MMASSDLSYLPEGLEEPFHSFIYVPIGTLKELFEPNVLLPRSRESRLNYLKYLDCMYEKDIQKPASTTTLWKNVSLEDSCIDPRLLMKEPGNQDAKNDIKPAEEMSKKPQHKMMREQNDGTTNWVSSQTVPKQFDSLLGFFKTQLAPHILADQRRPQTVTPDASPNFSKKRRFSHLEDSLKRGSLKKPKSEPVSK